MKGNNGWFNLSILVLMLVYLSVFSGCSVNNCIKPTEDEILEIQSSKYEPVGNKFIGIWPGDTLITSKEDSQELYDLGIRGIFLGDDWWFGAGGGNYDGEGYIYPGNYKDSRDFLSDCKIFPIVMKPVVSQEWKEEIQFYGADYYYIPEYIYNDLGTDFVLERLSYIKENALTSRLVLDDTHRLFRDTIKVFDCEYMYSAYEDKIEVLGVGIPVSSDQSGAWKRMKDKFGDKFYMGWVYGGGGCDEYKKLFKTANELNLKGIWVYFGDNEITRKQALEHIYQINEVAVDAGWLRTINIGYGTSY